MLFYKKQLLKVATLYVNTFIMNIFMEKMNFKTKLGAILLVLSSFVFASCMHTADVTDIPDVCFEKEVLPIFQNNCAMSGCHGSGSHEEFDATTYAGIMEVISPNSLSESEAYMSITNNLQIMPPSPYKALSKEQRTTIAVWITQGAKNTTCP